MVKDSLATVALELATVTIKMLAKENAELRAQVAALEALLQAKNTKANP